MSDFSSTKFMWKDRTYFLKQSELVFKWQGRNDSRLYLLYQVFFLILHFPPRLCDAGSSLRLWCLASTLKIAMNHRWLFSGPTMLHIISLHSTLLLSFYFCFSFHSHLVGFQRHRAKTSSFSFFCLLFFASTAFCLHLDFLEQ